MLAEVNTLVVQRKYAAQQRPKQHGNFLTQVAIQKKLVAVQAREDVPSQLKGDTVVTFIEFCILKPIHGCTKQRKVTAVAQHHDGIRCCSHIQSGESI